MLGGSSSSGDVNHTRWTPECPWVPRLSLRVLVVIVLPKTVIEKGTAFASRSPEEVAYSSRRGSMLTPTPVRSIHHRIVRPMIAPVDCSPYHSPIS